MMGLKNAFLLLFHSTFMVSILGLMDDGSKADYHVSIVLSDIVSILGLMDDG